MAEDSQISALVADSLPLVREGLVVLCESSGLVRVVGQAGDGREALRMICSLLPDIALLDLYLPDLHTLEVVHQARQMSEHTRLILLSTRADRKTVIEALRWGAHGFVLKSGPSTQLFEAIRVASQGGVYVSPSVQLQKLMASPRTQDFSDPLELLSSREHQVFTLLVQGMRAKEIAARLELSPKTVDTYRANLMKKLDIYDLAGLVKYAIERKLESAGIHGG
jgi:DNA-binding NarL/FixJ family response regulator